MVDANEKFILCSDLNGYVGNKRPSFDAVLGPYDDSRVNETGNHTHCGFIR